MNTCKKCNKTLDKSHKTFCNRSCSASYNNSISPKRRKSDNRFFNCLTCNTEFERQPHAIKTGNTKFCSVECMVKDKRNKSLKMFEEGLLTTRGSIRKVLLKKFGHKCSSCNLSEWMGKPIPLWTDHVDGCAKNNSPTNMRLICPNCDSQGDTFGSKNRGKGRISLGMKLYD